MALSKTVLSALIQQKVLAQYPPPPGETSNIDPKFYDAIAEAIVLHIQTAGVVTVAVAVDPVTHVGTGTGTVS